MVVLQSESSSWICSWGREHLLRTAWPWSLHKTHLSAEGRCLGWWIFRDTRMVCTAGNKTPLRPCCVSKFEGVVVLGISDCCLHTELPAGRFTVWSWRKMPKLDFVCVCGQLHVLLFSICLCMACPMRCQIFGRAQSPSSFLSAEIPSSSQDALQQEIALKY